jgi:small GTP-binding protein
LRDRLEGLPEQWVSFLEDLQKKLPKWQRERAETLLDRLPAMPKSLRVLFDKVYDRARTTFDNAPLEIVILGPVNSGKSTLVNALTGAEVAKVSPMPGTTRTAQSFSMGPFRVVDTPGMDEARGEDRTEIALEAARNADLILALFDAGSGITESHRQLYARIEALKKPTVVALNKIDLVKGYEENAVRSAEEILNTRAHAVSCKTGQHLGELMKALVVLDPRVINIMNDLLPKYQLEVARQRIATSAALAAAVGWEPLPVADIVPLMAIQALMVLEIGKLYGHPVTLSRAKELLATFAGGIALREGFRQVSKLIPIAGDYVSAGYAAAGTAALGAAAVAWFEAGGEMKEADARKIYRDALQRFRSRLLPKLTRPNLSKDRLEEEVETVIKALPASEDETATPQERDGLNAGTVP